MDQRDGQKLGADIAAGPTQYVGRPDIVQAIGRGAVGGHHGDAHDPGAGTQTADTNQGGPAVLIGTVIRRCETEMPELAVIVDDSQHRIGLPNGRPAGRGVKRQVHRLIRLRGRALDDGNGEGLAAVTRLESQRAGRGGVIHTVGRRAIARGITDLHHAAGKIGAGNSNGGIGAVFIDGIGWRTKAEHPGQEVVVKNGHRRRILPAQRHAERHSLAAQKHGGFRIGQGKIGVHIPGQDSVVADGQKDIWLGGSHRNGGIVLPIDGGAGQP